MITNKRIKYHLLTLMVLALVTLAACDKIKSAYCTNVVPFLNKPCSQPLPAPVPLAEVK